MDEKFIDNLIEKYETDGIEAVGSGFAKFYTATNVSMYKEDIMYKSAPFSRDGGLRNVFICGYNITEINVFLDYNFTSGVHIKIGNQTEKEVRKNRKLYDCCLTTYKGKADSAFFTMSDFYEERWTDIEYKKSQFNLIKSYMDYKYGDGEKNQEYSYEYYVYSGYTLLGIITLNLEEELDENNKKYYYTILYYYQNNDKQTLKYLNEL